MTLDNNEYFAKLFSYMLSADELHSKYPNNDIGEVIQHLFRPDVQNIMTYYEDDSYGEGVACVVYHCHNRYFHLLVNFGGSCDEWMMEPTLDNHRDILDALQNDIRNNTVENIYEVIAPLRRYPRVNVALASEWKVVLCAYDDHAFRKCSQLACEQDVAAKMHPDNRAIRKRQIEEDEASMRKRIKDYVQLISDVEDVLTYLETKDAQTDSYFPQKVDSKVKLLTYCLPKMESAIEYIYTATDFIKRRMGRAIEQQQHV